MNKKEKFFFHYTKDNNDQKKKKKKKVIKCLPSESNGHVNLFASPQSNPNENRSNTTAKIIKKVIKALKSVHFLSVLGP